MTFEKFNEEIDTIRKFFPIYCDGKHKDKQKRYEKSIIYQNKKIEFKIDLCEECKTIFDYSVIRLTECQYEDKPKCRKCKTPCYEKVMWKKVAKIMMYAGIKSKIKSLI